MLWHNHRALTQTLVSDSSPMIDDRWVNSARRCERRAALRKIFGSLGINIEAERRTYRRASSLVLLLLGHCV